MVCFLLLSLHLPSVKYGNKLGAQGYRKFFDIVLSGLPEQRIAKRWFEWNRLGVRFNSIHVPSVLDVTPKITNIAQ